MISGTIGYIKMKYKHSLYIFFLDNHDTNEYCSKIKDEMIYIHDIFDKIFSDYNLYLEEPIIKDDSLKLMFTSEHVTKYLKYLETKNAIKFDVRFQLESKNINQTFYNVLLFLNSVCMSSSEVGKNHFHSIILFIYHYFKYYSQNKIPRKGHSSLIYTYFPFVDSEKIVHTLSNNELKEILLSSTMEYYLIMLLLNTNKNNNIIYLGAAHGVTVTRILRKYYEFELEKDLDINGIENDVFDLSQLDVLKSCI
jgi:hypothetical protein